MIDVSVEGNRKVLVAGEQTEGRFAVIEARERRGAAPPRHVHSREDEVIYLLEGRLTLELDGGQLDCPAGSTLFLPRGSEHTFRVESRDARLLILLSPAGLEACLPELCWADQPGADQQRIERLVAIAARYGVTITGPARPP